MKEEEKRVIEETISRFLIEIYYKRLKSAVKDLVDLSYYMNLKGLDREYLEIFDRLLEEARKTIPGWRLLSFVDMLDDNLQKVREGPEAYFMGNLISEAERIKESKFAYITKPGEEIKKKAKKIVEEVLK